MPLSRYLFSVITIFGPFGLKYFVGAHETETTIQLYQLVMINQSYDAFFFLIFRIIFGEN